jgi:hypothetical protein
MIMACANNGLSHPQSLQAYMAVLADDQMIMDGDFEGLALRDDLMGEVDVVSRRLRISRGMIVDQYTHKSRCGTMIYINVKSNW